MGRLRDDVPQEFPASGNIAHVLRQARASLKDPSRPFTPTERRECNRQQGDSATSSKVSVLKA